MNLHREEGEAVFVHECERGPHAVHVSWGAGYPALDQDSLPSCECGGDWERVEPCQGSLVHQVDEQGQVVRQGDHDCHPIAGHVVRSDDHTANLIPVPRPDPEEQELERLRRQRWELEQRELIGQLEGLLSAGGLDERHALAARITLIEARRALREVEAQKRLSA